MNHGLLARPDVSGALANGLLEAASDLARFNTFASSLTPGQTCFNKRGRPSSWEFNWTARDELAFHPQPYSDPV